MAKKNTFIDDLINNMQPPQGGSAIPTGPQFGQKPFSVPQALPADPQVAPPSLTPGNLNIVPSTLDPNFTTSAPAAQPEQAQQGAFRPTGGGGFSFGGDVPIPATREEGFIPTPEALFTGGTPEFAAQGQAPSPAGLVDPFGVTQEQIEQAGNANFGAATSMEAPPHFNPGGMGVNSLSPAAISEIQQLNRQTPEQGTIAPPDPLQGFTTEGGQKLSEFLKGGTQLGGLGDSGEAGRAALQQHGEQAGTRVRPDGTFADFSNNRGPDARDRDSGGISDADRRDMANANKPGASAGDVARGNEIAARAGVDLRTGRPLASEGGLSVSEQVALSAEERALRKEKGAAKAAETEEAQSLSRAKSAAKGLVQQSENIGDIAKTAQRQAGKAFTTGVGGLLMSIKPGSTAKDMRANLDTLTADAAFTSLQAMRDASKTGGALGQVSERELTLLGAAVRSLDANQSDEQLTGNIKEYVRLRNQSMKRIREAFAADYGRVAADEVFGGQEQSGKRHANDQDSGQSIEELTLPKSK